MNVIKVIAPIPIEELKKFFIDKEKTFLIDYANSELKGQKLLSYLSNLDLPVDLENIDRDLLLSYFKSQNLVKIPILERNALEILFKFKFEPKESHEVFLKENESIFEKWTKRLDSLSLYNLYITGGDLFHDYVKTFPEDSTNDLEGVNFLSLLAYPDFYLWFEKIDESSLTYYSKYFNDYMFKGKNLFEFWATDANPMFLLTLGVASGVEGVEKYQKARIELEKKEVFDDSSL